ncbi:MAG: hypothetical protein M3303_15660 [Gemmatimonadota bacterium]|nr:hypothetical protein [Gemmatimonadota bacterium]
MPTLTFCIKKRPDASAVLVLVRADGTTEERRRMSMNRGGVRRRTDVIVGSRAAVRE